MGYRCESVFIGGRVFPDCGEAGRIRMTNTDAHGCTPMGYRCESVFIGGRVFSDCGEAGRISNDEHRCTRMHTHGLSV
ncbi:hypothetical protein [Fischerella sp. NIES-3754]|uniref:hypothetical protein n=1 Tax=Fischerella sp. NIES-3754 TaxID=1752063 RepID=UPI00071F1A67|nr:hypothetical protein [Fischerella sp. NIES-3754]BAU04620.1 hypothetical protein FIS3754_05080 [Fischerella sp. NIES-3754]BCX06860.1 MAG: hypothetical protein KatS3mg066_0719 [Fischerella sp.]